MIHERDFAVKVDYFVDVHVDVLIEEARPGRLEWPEPAAISIPFATLPIKTYIKGPEYKVSFNSEFP